MGRLKKAFLSAAAAATALGALAPAAAGGGHYGGYGYGPPHGRAYGHYKHHPRYYGGADYYYGSRHYRHRRGYISGGEAALIAAGIIGGVILIDRAMESGRRYDRPYRDRYERDPDDGYYRRDGRYDDGRYDDYDDRYGARRYDDRRYGALDDALEGAGGRGEYNYGAAYNDCKAETRDAARDSGLTVALPAKPERIVPIEDGRAVRFEASYLASDGRGGEWRREMTCEADEGGVRFLELA